MGGDEHQLLTLAIVRHGNDSMGEIWEGGRSVGRQEEALITENTFYSLPPRVCIQFQPAQLAKVCFTSHVPVSTELRQAFDEFLLTLAPAIAADPEPSEISTKTPETTKPISTTPALVSTSTPTSEATAKPLNPDSILDSFSDFAIVSDDEMLSLLDE